MPAPRINPALLSAETRANLAKVQAELNFGVRQQIVSKECEPEKEVSKNRRSGKATLTPDKADSLITDVYVSEDKNEVRFLIDANPSEVPTAQGKGAFVDKSGHVHFFTKPKQRKAEQTFQNAFSKHSELTRRWGDVPIEVEFYYFFGYPSGTPKKKMHTIGPMTEKPDASNISKGICDALTRAGMWKDDSYIQKETSKKCRTKNRPHMEIRIINLQPMFDELFRKEEERDSLFSSCQ